MDLTVELARGSDDLPAESATTRLDLPQRTAASTPSAEEQPEHTRVMRAPTSSSAADPTREDLPRGGGGASTAEAAEAAPAAAEAPPGEPPDRSATPAGTRLDPSPRNGAGARPRRRRRWGWRALCALLALIVGTPLYAGFRVWYIARQDDRRHSDAIIVLGAAQYNGRPSAVLEWRLLHALKLYREGVAPHIVTVGGNQPGDVYTEAGTGKRWLNEHGVPSDRLVAVRSGRDTLQSMIAVGREYQRLGWHTGVIVTDPWHALRSRTMARDNGIKAVTSPTRSGPTVGSRDTQFHYIVRETGGYLYYVLVGRYRDDP